MGKEPVPAHLLGWVALARGTLLLQVSLTSPFSKLLECVPHAQRNSSLTGLPPCQVWSVWSLPLFLPTSSLGSGHPSACGVAEPIILLLLGGHTFPLKPTFPSPSKVVSDHFFLDTGETAVPGQATWGGGVGKGV